MNQNSVSLLLLPPFTCLQQCGLTLELLKREGKKAIEAFDVSLKGLTLQELRDLYLILETKDHDGLALYPLARQYGNEVMIPRLSANIAHKIACRLQEQMLSISDIAHLGLEFVSARITWSFESNSRLTVLRTILRGLIDAHKYAHPTDTQTISAIVRKIVIANTLECKELLLEIEQLLHLKRLYPHVVASLKASKTQEAVAV